MHEYYYLGSETALTRLHGSERHLCIDTRSGESLLLAIGYPIEPVEIGVMLRFLAPGDFFIDVGANFGLFSIMAYDRLGPRGTLYAFEANPHTYGFLSKSAIVNRLHALPNYHFINRAVTDHSGSMPFVYSPGMLGSAHLDEGRHGTADWIKIDVAAVALDDFLPPETKANFVKLDIEGGEFAAIRGMRRLIDRSPDIRILFEHYLQVGATAEHATDLLALLRSLGLHVLIVKGDGELELLPDGNVPTANSYLLATRTPERDLHIGKEAILIPPRSLHYHRVFADEGVPMLRPDGVFEYRSEGRQHIAEPALFFGPYMPLAKGTYQLVLHGEWQGAVDIAVTRELGHCEIARQVITNADRQIPFTLHENAADIEIILRKFPDLTHVMLTSLEIRRI
ncbi:MAG: FkbM family methyltransferase [Methylobacterium sp.]|jgi:FkbM family methyltransferase|nr:FkbM family methyltransferase [Methylobacterium sp.]MCA3604507.1 FkbM family methyltransferase [Methylobacterium sp.]MCA3612984.1 FkbM family methyltransferase [Methylobacterium sp.]MCA3616131.1 FkbM family methyltransferase [Methylobacterium sp.]MCA3625237.1 FkbM family methyltransferase [Methylobacterium sp.]